jgi:hypothetical protein
VKTLRAGAWVPLTGAKVHTDSTGHYTMRIILDAKGARQLRVVADPDAPGVGNSHKGLNITVG